MKYKTILLTLLEITRKTGNLEEYFVQNTNEFYLYLFPPSFVEKGSTLIYYKEGNKVWERHLFWYKGKQKLIKMFFYYLYLAYILLFVVPRKTIYVTYQPLFCVGSSFYRLIKRTTLVFCVGDYFPRRYDFITKLYHFLTLYYMKRCRYVLLPSPMYEEVYGVPRVKGQHRDELKYAIKKITIQREPVLNQMGYIGNVRLGQGLEVIFEALQKNPHLKLDMIGHGERLPTYKELAAKKGVSDRIVFHGFVEKDEDMKNIISRWQIGLAVYDPSPTNMTYYTEPSKVKMYLQYGIPVIMTKITYISQELVATKAGETVDYNAESLLAAIERMQIQYNQYSDGVESLRDKYELTKYYDKHLRFLSHL